MAWGSISLFAGFLEKQNSLETLIVIFEHVSPKGFFWLNMKNFQISVLTANSRYLQTAALKQVSVKRDSTILTSLFVLNNGAETNCGIAHILGILLMNSYDNKVYFLAATIICSLSTLNTTERATTGVVGKKSNNTKNIRVKLNPNEWPMLEFQH